MGTGNSKEISDQGIIEQIDQAINEERKAQQIKNLREFLSISDLKKSEKPNKTVQERIEFAGFDSVPISEKNLSQEKALKRTTYDQDGRTRVNLPQEWPYSVHSLLNMKFNDTLYTGTATMIGPNIAITAARNLYGFENKIEVKVSDIHFYPAVNNQLLPFGTVQVQAFYYPEEFKTTGKEDYAILILQQDIGHQTGYFGVHAMEKQGIKSKRINITGYPADKVADKPKHHQMWEMEGRVCHVDDDLISYQIDTSAGQSGSGIWYEVEDEYYVVGVHVHYSGAYNQGTFINKKRLRKIRDWIWSFYSKSEHAQIQVQSLNLANKKIGERGAEYPSKANLQQLQSLNLYQNQIGDKGAESLSKANFPQLQKLELPWKEISEKGAEYLSKANFPQLQSLELIGDKIGKKGAEYLSIANFPKLQFIDLSSNRIGDKGVEYLSKANFPELLSLHLSWNQIGEKGAEYLSKANFRWLQSLNLQGNQIGKKGEAFLSHYSNKINL